MNTKSRTRRSESDRQDLLNQQSMSGQSVRAFCKKQNISCQSFYAWRRRLPSGPEIDAPANMIDISSMVTTAVKQNWSIELDLGGGIKLNLKQA